MNTFSNCPVLKIKVPLKSIYFWLDNNNNMSLKRSFLGCGKLLFACIESICIEKDADGFKVQLIVINYSPNTLNVNICFPLL